MALKTSLNHSPNFDPKKRTKKQIKFIIMHYTGMKSESSAIKRLTNIQSQVSCHYLIKRNGEIISLVPDLYTAWHAGKSKWKSYNSLNKNSIGIEITNPGHNLGYKKYSKSQLLSVIKLCRYLKKKYNLYSKNILGHSDIAPERKKDPGEKFPWKYLSKKNICFWHKIKKNILLKNRNLETKDDEKKLFLSNLSEIGYSVKPQKNSKINRIKFLKIIVTVFQMRYRQELINGVIDQECLIISKNLIINDS